MKLISLTLTPAGNPLDETMEVILDHNPDIYKSTYIRVVRMGDGTIKLTDYPTSLTSVELDAAYRHALVIIDMVHDITSGF